MYEFGNDRLGDEGVVRHGMLLRERDALAVGGGDVCEFSVVPICRMEEYVRYVVYIYLFYILVQIPP